MKDEWLKLLNGFKHIKIPKRELTYLELCRYPCARFEEICSRILQFFFNPYEVHGMDDLWLKSLFKAIGTSPRGYDSLSVNTEEQADGKRIDITIIGNRYKDNRIDRKESFVIAIENKIDAELYNPLDTYAGYIQKKYNDRDNHYLVVLSLKRQNSSKADHYNFKCITYSDLFDELLKDAAKYLIYNNSQYKMIMSDFIKTINNMEIQMPEEAINFFKDNHDSIEVLLSEYNKYKDFVSQEQTTRLKSIVNELNRTIDGDNLPRWNNWKDELISVRFEDRDKNEIGIEAQFTDTKDIHCNEMFVWIRFWNQKHWEAYRNNDIFKNITPEEKDGSYFYHLNKQYTLDIDFFSIVNEEYKKILSLTSSK